jgi:hypothetical protein
MAPFIPVGMIGVVALFVVLARLPDNSALRGALTNDGNTSSAAVSDACAVDAVGVTCRCVVRAEDECSDMQGKFYAKKDGGIDACLKVCAAAE